jgi:hypothetical protein
MTTEEPRTGVTPVVRPTEWTVGVAMLITAVLAWQTDHDTAALVAVGAAVLPTLVTAVAAWYERRQAAKAPVDA